MLLHSLLASSVERWPGAVAIDIPPGSQRSRRQQQTYAELAACAEALKGRLRSFVTGECVVAILLDRTTPQLWAAQIAVLQAGAAFVCIDPTYPDDHVDFVLQDASVVALLTDVAGAARVRPERLPAGRVLDVHAPSTAAAASTRAGDPAWLTTESLAYVIYTSGTTGRPKGVLLQHGGVVALIRAGVARFALAPGDRIAQGSSHAYDSSIEETWLALASGATVVSVDDETVRLGPDLVRWLRGERITVLCPPPTLLRAMHCVEPARELPSLRLCYAGGEAMPQDLCDLWARDLWLENGYGPTECTVTVVRGRLHAGQPVTIGAPVPGHRALLLGTDLEEVPEGQQGELCIAGPGLARGYLGHEDLTRQRFVQHARFGRLYRTGDLAGRAADGTLTCLGRIDTQVKVRGHRIEIEAVEVALAGCAGVREAACRVEGEGSEAVLVACIVAVSPDAPPPFADLTAQLRRTLPLAMVPTVLVVMSALPRTIGGKLDRKALPGTALAATPERGLAGIGTDGDVPRDPVERRIAATFTARLPGHPHAGPDDDFFALGGDSLRAAQVITDLRQDVSTASLTVRDLYGARTVRGLAACVRLVQAVAETDSAAPVAAAGETAHPWLVTMAQLACLTTGLFVGCQAAVLGMFDLVPWLAERLGVLPFVLLSPFLWRLGLLLWAPIAVWIAVFAKETLIGGYTPRSVPVWSWFYLRNWIVLRVVQLVPWRELQGTEFHNIALRALGARIGRRVHLHRGVDLLEGGWDLLDLGDDVTVAQEASLGLVDLDAGRLVIGPVRIGQGATLDVRAGLGPGTEVGAGALLTALSSLPQGSRVPAGERWDGVPARAAGRAPAPPVVTVPGRQLPPLAHGCLLLAMRLLTAPVVLLPFSLLVVFVAPHLGIDAVAFLGWFERPWVDERALVSGLMLVAIAVPGRLVVQALMLRWLPSAPLGTSSRWSVSYCLVWQRTEVLQSAGVWLSGSLLWPLWLRLAGMRIGNRCEVSTVLDVLPEHVTIGEGSFLADGIYLGSPWLQAGTVTVRPTRLGSSTFLGNHVVVPAGQQLPDDLVLGVSTVADDRMMSKDTGWFGHPPFQLPRREVVVLDRHLTHEPGVLRRGNRLAWELLRFLLPLLPAVLLWWWLLVVTAAMADKSPTMLLCVVAPSASAAVATGACLFVLVLKWLLLGRVAPGQHGLWSSWASRWDFLYVAWGFLARGVLSRFEGTLVLCQVARAMGARVGRRVVMGPGFAQIVDPDMLHLGDGATVSAMFQAHSFEDRVLKIDHVHVGVGATVAPGTVLLYGARVGDHTKVGMHSVVMKHEHLLPGHHYEGAPLAPTSMRVVSEAFADAALAPTAAATSPWPRDLALDVARGLAVLGMVWTHLVPTDGASGALDGLAAFLAEHLEAWSAVLFTLLLGMAVGLQARQGEIAGSGRAMLRRALLLVAGGVLLGWSIWPTEILTALGLMLPLVWWLHRRGTGWCLGVVGVLLVLTPVATSCCGHFVDGDWLEEGSVPAVWSTFGWVTLRYATFDGNYPLLPWLCFPLLGAVIARAGLGNRARLVRWFWLAASGACAWPLVDRWVVADGERLGDLALHLQSTWGPPTSVPFVLLHSASTVATVAALCWWQVARSRGPFQLRGASVIAAIGRSSLSHYVLHLVLVVVPLRLWCPGEDWSIGVGVASCGVYAAVMVPCTWLWFRRWRRGPLEGLLAWAGRAPFSRAQTRGEGQR